MLLGTAKKVYSWPIQKMDSGTKLKKRVILIDLVIHKTNNTNKEHKTKNDLLLGIIVLVIKNTKVKINSFWSLVSFC